MDLDSELNAELANTSSLPFQADKIGLGLPSIKTEDIRVFQYEHVFFMGLTLLLSPSHMFIYIYIYIYGCAGDLNYRLVVKDLASITEAIATRDLDWLVSHDQLLLEKERGNVFQGFTEASINFLPTYKYVLNSHEYEYFKGKKKKKKKNQSSISVLLNNNNLDDLSINSNNATTGPGRHSDSTIDARAKNSEGTDIKQFPSALCQQHHHRFNSDSSSGTHSAPGGSNSKLAKSTKPRLNLLELRALDLDSTQGRRMATLFCHIAVAHTRDARLRLTSYSSVGL